MSKARSLEEFTRETFENYAKAQNETRLMQPQAKQPPTPVQAVQAPPLVQDRQALPQVRDRQGSVMERGSRFVWACGRFIRPLAIAALAAYLVFGCELGLPYACFVRNWMLVGGLLWLASQLFASSSWLASQLFASRSQPSSKKADEANPDSHRKGQAPPKCPDACDTHDFVKLHALGNEFDRLLQSPRVQNMIQSAVAYKMSSFVKQLSQLEGKQSTPAENLANDVAMSALRSDIQDLRSKLAELAAEAVHADKVDALAADLTRLERAVQPLSGSVEGIEEKVSRGLGMLNHTAGAQIAQLGSRLSATEQALAGQASSLSLVWYHTVFLGTCAVAGVLALHAVLAVVRKGAAPFEQLKALVALCRSRPLEVVTMYWTAVAPCALALGVIWYHAGLIATGWVVLTLLGVHAAYALVGARERSAEDESRVLDRVYVRKDVFEKTVRELRLLVPSHRAQGCKPAQDNGNKPAKNPALRVVAVKATTKNSDANPEMVSP